MPNYYAYNTASDLSPSWPNTAAGNWAVQGGSGSSTTETVSLTSTQTKSGSWITNANKPNSAAWEDSGTWTGKIMTQSGGQNMNVRARMRAVRLNSTGTILQSGTFTAFQTLSTSATTYTYSITAPAWTDAQEACNNRLAVEIEYNNLDTMTQSVGVNHLPTSAVTIATDITENAGGCAVPFKPKTVVF